MMRSLYTAATGMIAQQTNLDTISNNLSNVNTTGYKTERTEFKSLLYQTLQTKATTANGANKPVGAQVGLGTRVAATMSNYTQGAREETEIPTDFALEGKGFFAVRGVDGQTYYTRNGNFSWSQDSNGNTILATSEGLPVLDSEAMKTRLTAITINAFRTDPCQVIITFERSGRCRSFYYRLEEYGTTISRCSLGRISLD